MQHTQAATPSTSGLAEVKRVAEGITRRLRELGVEVTHTKLLEALAGEAGYACYRALAAVRHPAAQADQAPSAQSAHADAMTRFVDRVADMYRWDDGWGEMDDNGVQCLPEEGYADSHEALMDLIQEARRLRPNTMLESRPFVAYDADKSDLGEPCFWNAENEEWSGLDHATRYTLESVETGAVTNDGLPEGATLLNVGAMKHYTVLLGLLDEGLLRYHYFADDEAHAKEQAIDAEPQACVLAVAPHGTSEIKLMELAVESRGWKVQSNGSDDGWYALMPGETEFFDNLEQHEADPENVPHRQNYLGFFSSREDALAGVLQQAKS